jgi:hypothetical protein
MATRSSLDVKNGGGSVFSVIDVSWEIISTSMARVHWGKS